MSRFLRLSMLATVILLMMACLAQCPGPTPAPPAIPFPELKVQAQPSTYNAVGQQIAYSYLVTNNGTSRLAEPVTILDNKATVDPCPSVTTIGNKDRYLDIGESITCTGRYNIAQADLSTGSLTNIATASAGGQTSSQVSTTIQGPPPNPVLTLTISPNPNSYSQAGQTIAYSYEIRNTGTATLGPDQFKVTDSLFPNPINCGTPVSLATNQTVTCKADYVTTPADAGATQIVNTATATGGGAGTIQPATATVIRSNVTLTPPVNITPGTTRYHDVIRGDWLLQISRCYGANFTAVVRANPLVKDPDLIYYPSTVTVPNVGSDGRIYGPPCFIFYKAVSGDTWQSIADKFNADIDVLRAANKNVTLAAGVQVKVPINSKGGAPVAPVTPIPTTAIPPTPITPTVRPPIRLNFPAGNPTSVSQPGTIGTPDTIRYVFTGTTGQILTVKLAVPTNDVSLAIYAPNNSVLKPLDLNTSWTGTLPMNGDYAIDLVSSLGATSKNFTLDVTLNTPVTPATLTPAPFTPVPNSPTVRVTDIYLGPSDSSPSYLTTFNGQLYFQANANDGAGRELFRYNGSGNPTRAADINPGANGSDPSFLAVYKDHLYFRANGGDAGGQVGAELWRLNMSGQAGLVADIFKGPGDSNPGYMAVYNDILYFSANGNDGFGTELWRYDGSTNPTRVADINQGPGNSNPSYLVVYNNVLYFAATTSNGGTELWKFDGTNPSLAVDIVPGSGNSNPAFLSVFNNQLYFSANGSDGYGTELWRYDAINPPARAADINPGPADSVPTYMTVFNTQLYFGAIGDSSGFELWKFDGTTPTRVSNINTTGSSNPAYLAVYNNELYFQANGNDGAGIELWKFKGP